MLPDDNSTNFKTLIYTVIIPLLYRKDSFNV